MGAMTHEEWVELMGSARSLFGNSPEILDIINIIDSKGCAPTYKEERILNIVLELSERADNNRQQKVAVDKLIGDKFFDKLALSEMILSRDTLPETIEYIRKKLGVLDSHLYDEEIYSQSYYGDCSYEHSYWASKREALHTFLEKYKL